MCGQVNVIPDPAPAIAELSARNATAAAAAGCWPHLATGSGREASVYLEVGVGLSRRVQALMWYVHGIWVAACGCIPEVLVKILS